MDTKKLRQKILDLAIRGKLVPQDPNDEPASVLLERIRAEKERLIKEGKIKRSKKTAADDEIEAPFEIPESWMWCKLDDFLLLLSGQDFPPSKYNSEAKGVPYIIGASNIENEKLSVNRWTETPSVISILNDVLVVCKGAGVGKIAMNDVGDVHIARQIQAIRDETGITNSKYIKICVASNISSIIANANGLIPGLKRELLLSLLVPIAPIEEQKRIVSAVEQLYSSIDALENNEGDLLKSIDQAKSKILDLAIHGKLVPQDPNDEPAIELLRRINPKFEPCDNEDYPFEIPQSWEWTTLGVISNYGNTVNVDIQDISKNAWVLELEDLEKDSAKLINRITKGEREIKGTRHHFKKGDVLYSKLRTYLNKVLVAPENGYCTTEIIPISFYSHVQSSYINHVLRSKYFLDYTIQCGYGVKMPRLSTSDARKGLIPLPPYQEQLRIVAKIEELLAVLDSIKESLE